MFCGLPRLLIEREALFPQLLRRARADPRHSFFPGDILVVTLLSLCGRGENRLVELDRFGKPGGKLDTANRACPPVVIPPRACQVPSHHALDRARLRLLNQHRASRKLIAERLKLRGIIRYVCRQKMTGYSAAKELEPEA